MAGNKPSEQTVTGLGFDLVDSTFRYGGLLRR
jgi:hypothetical protein